MKKGEKDYINLDSNDGISVLKMEADKSRESDFFLSKQNDDIDKKAEGEEKLEQKKGKIKIDKSILFFLNDFPMFDKDGE